MKTAVIYKSKSGFAKKYAEWIAQALSAEIYDKPLDFTRRKDVDELVSYVNLIQFHTTFKY